MTYDYAKDIFDELKNYEGKATFEGSETGIDYFVLLPKEELDDFSLAGFLEQYTANTSFEVEGNHSLAYTIIGINATLPDYTDDADYLAKLTVW
ncbi:hypothetical protein [Flavobacterium psychrotrophum]|uniref:hypothetical protein n=1 Tax=Flavobacterium psychrotrophum TaxID=2294119 RepID=UPI0013C4202D|nr:hypothetical protein [Flavobacterium psychrotrophum]